MDGYERREMESLYFDGLKLRVTALREELGEARLRHGAAVGYAGEWRGEAAKVGEYGPGAVRDFARAAWEWERRAEREAAEVEQLANYWV